MWGFLPDQSPFHSAPFAEGLLCAQPQAAGKMDVTLCCLLVTLLVLVGLGGPIVRGSQGGFHEQVDLGLELGAREVRQVTLGVSSEVPASSHPSWDSFPHVPPRH